MISYGWKKNENCKGRKYKNELCKEKWSRSPALPYHCSTIVVSRAGGSRHRRPGIRHTDRYDPYTAPYKKGTLYSRGQLYIKEDSPGRSRLLRLRHEPDRNPCQGK